MAKMSSKASFTLPDFLAQCPFEWTKNPLYTTAGPDSVAWLEEFFEGKKLRHFKDARTDILISYTYPYVDSECFRLCADNLNLLFVLDDINDAQDGEGARQTHETFLQSLNSDRCEDSVVSRMTVDFMARHGKRFSPILLRRFLQHNQEYISSVVREAGLRERGEILTLDEYRKLRRDNSGVILAFDFIEVSLGFDLPEEVREDPTFQQIYYAALDMVNFSNDVLSYKVERAQGLAGCNVLTVLMHNKGLSLQEAVDYSGVMYQTLLQQMIQGKASLRSFSPEVDEKLREYIKGLEDWVIGSLHWSFESERYFGDDAGKAKFRKDISL